MRVTNDVGVTIKVFEGVVNAPGNSDSNFLVGEKVPGRDITERLDGAVEAIV